MSEYIPWGDPLAEILEGRGERIEIELPALGPFFAKFASITFFVIVFCFLGFHWSRRDTCIETHIIEKNGQMISLPHERDAQGCIIDFDHPLGYEK